MRFLFFFLLFFTGCTAAPMVLTGKPITIASIGGETTGTGLAVGETVVETDVRMLSERISVTGHWETRKGIERGEYKVFIVDAINKPDGN